MDFFDQIRLNSNVASPFNYTGSKYKMLPVLFKHFPKNYNSFYDIFAGGGSVFINVPPQKKSKIYVNDILSPLIDFYKILQITPWQDIIIKIKEKNIPKKNHQKYNELRERFNKTRDPIDFYILTCSCSNNMMRFNQKMEFNQTFGERNFNSNIKEKLKRYHERIYQNEQIIFLNKNFTEIKPEDDGFVYLDPPYLITEAGYNMYWSEKMEKELYDYIDRLNERKIKFMLSNVLEHKNIKNPHVNKLSKYNIIPIEYDYDLVSKSGESKSQEVIVFNF